MRRHRGPILVMALALGACAGVQRPPPAGSPPPASAAAPAAPRRIAALQRAPGSPPVRTEARAVLGAVGDVLMHGAVKQSAAAHRSPGDPDGYGWLYADVRDLLAEPDLQFANLETPIAPQADQGSRSFVFNAPPAAARALKDAGVDLVSVANNHVFDQKRPGFLETLRQLDAVGLPYVGAGAAPGEAGPRRFAVHGISIAWLAWSRFFNDVGNDCASREPPPCVRAALLDGDRAVAAVRDAARSADAVVVSLHWGEEYAPEPRAADVDLAHRLADAGALVILGHHPHVLQPIELYRRADGRTAVIAYSLGNFVSNQSRHYVPGVTPDRAAATREGALVRIALERVDYGGGVVQVEVGGADYLPLWTENDTVEVESRRAGTAPAIRVVALDRALARIRAELRTIADPVPERDRLRWIELRRREQAYLARKAEIAAVLGEDLEGPAPR